MASSPVTWNDVRPWLVALTDDLRVAPSTSPADTLLAARKDIAIAMMDDQIADVDSFEHRFMYYPDLISLPPSRWAPYDAAKPTAPIAGQRVARRTLGLPSKAVNFDGWPPGKIFGRKPSVTHGPFLDRLDRTVYVDVFRPSPVLEYAFPANGSPAYLYVTAPVTSPGQFVVNLGAGTVWIRADLFTKSSPVGKQAPSDTYFGLAIQSGTMTIPPAPTGSRTLTVKLAGGATNSPIFSITPVVDVSFLFNSTINAVQSGNTVNQIAEVTASIASIGTGKVTVMGSTFNMQQASYSASYDASTGRINFAMSADNATFQPVSQNSQLVESTGASKLTAAAWSVLVKRADQKMFYEMSSPGGFAFFLTGGNTIGVRGVDLPLSLNACTLIAEPGSLVITGSRGSMPLRSRMVMVGKTSSGSATNKSSITFRAGKFTRFSYMAMASGAESWTVLADVSFALDQPRTVNNERVIIEGQNGVERPWSTLTWFQDPASSGLSLNIQATNVERQTDEVAFALKNFLIKADIPRAIDVAGRYEAGVLVSGGLTMVSVLRNTLPFLPDPYVTNFELVLDSAIEKNGMGYLTISEKWKEGAMDPLGIELMTQLVIPARTMARNQVQNSDDAIQSQIKTFWGDGSFSRQEIESGIMPDLGLGQLFHIPDAKETTGIFHPPTLLDISSSSSQFGVVFGTGTRAFQRLELRQPSIPSFALVEEFNISGLMLESSLSNVRVMALPAVQWESVLEDKAPHETYSFPYSGPSTQIAIRDVNAAAPSVRLVPVAPREAIDSLVDSFNSSTSFAVAARCSLPFGMVALATMDNEVLPLRSPAQVQQIQFTLGSDEDLKTTLKSPELKPVHQLWFKPPGRRRLRFRFPSGPPPEPQPGIPLKLVESSDVSFSGITTVLAMGVGPLKDPPAAGRAELIDPATPAFNDDMKNKVPLLRFDISGYGATIFSDWKRVLGPPQDPQQDPPPAITKVLMNVLTGRTSREVIVLNSVMAPFAVAVVKTIEIRRLNNGVVLRHESDWQATSIGSYFYQNPDIITHPGIIKGVSDVRNITDVSGTTTVAGVPLEVRMVQFDCNVKIEDGGINREIPGVRLDGCVFLKAKDLNKPDGPVQYANLLQSLNLGGHIDAIVQIGKSTQQKRLTSISVKPTLDPASGKQVAVVAAMGSPIFVGGGQWSFARTQSFDSFHQPHPVDLAKGVPLVKVGRHDSPSLESMATPYLFRDPQDLLRSSPGTVYNIIHGAASHRVLFTNPEIPFVQGAQKGFQATQVWVADSIALGKSASIFPTLLDCLPVLPDPLPQDAKQLLELVPGEGYKFEPTRILRNGLQVPQLELPDLERTIKEDSSVKTVAQAIKDGSALKDGVKELDADIRAAKTTLSVAINTLDNISKIDVTNIHMVTKTVNGAVDDVNKVVKDANRVIGRLSSDAKKVGGLLGADPDIHLPDLPDLPKAADEVKHVFGSALEQVQKAVSFLENLKFLPHFKVSMTNEWSMMMSTSMNKDDLLNKIQPPTREVVAKIIESFDFLISASITLSTFLLKMHIGTTIKIPTGVGPIVALGTGAFDIALGTSGVEVMLNLGFGIGVDFSVGPFSASASYTQSQTILFREGVFGLGITACMRAHVDLVVASADLYLEAKLLVVGGTCDKDHHPAHGGTTIWGYASVKIALHVSIFLICNIGYEEEAHWDSNLNGGSCLLEYMTDLVR